MHFALQKLKILPHEWLALDTQEKAFIIASIHVYAAEQQKYNT
ncbi:hypothetical protein [Granulicatella balaenopterae]